MTKDKSKETSKVTSAPEDKNILEAETSQSEDPSSIPEVVVLEETINKIQLVKKLRQEKSGILTKEAEEEIAAEMKRGKTLAIAAVLKVKCMENSIDYLLKWVMQHSGRVWRFLEDPRDEGVGETSMQDAINRLSKINVELVRTSNKLSTIFKENIVEKDVAKLKNLRRRIRRANKKRDFLINEKLGYNIRIEFFDDLSQRFRKGVSLYFHGKDEIAFIDEYGASYEEFKEIMASFFAGEKLFQKSRERLIMANQRLVIYFARKYQEQGVDLADLIGEGNIGLLRAVERFEPSKGSRLATYATWWIKHNLNRAVANQGSTIRVPGHVREEKNRILKVITEMSIASGRQPNMEDVANELGITIDRIHRILRRTQGTISIDKPLGHDSEDETLQKLLPNHAVLTPEEEVSKNFDKKWVKELLLDISPRERLIIEMRFGLTGRDPMTLQEVGTILKITRERVRQLQTKAESKLYKLARKKGFSL
jgi:RNA polymerase sigma factor (sigma-70 family)